MTYLDASLKAAVGGEHDEGRRLEGVLRWQQDAPVVDAALMGMELSSRVQRSAHPEASYRATRNGQQTKHQLNGRR